VNILEILGVSVTAFFTGIFYNLAFSWLLLQVHEPLAEAYSEKLPYAFVAWIVASWLLYASLL
jgi:hypothetical protein